MKLLETWAGWEARSAPFVLDGDRPALNAERCARSLITRRSWAEAFQAPDFCQPGDTRLHLGLLPQPFFGDVRRASIYVLLLNPGLSADDYYGEYEVPEYRASILSNLKQDPTGARGSFLFLNPQFGWHAGFHWWHGKLAAVIKKLASARGISFAEARSMLAASIASIEMVPYHSASFKDAGNWLSRLESAKLARDFVKEFVGPRVQAGEAIIIATRQVAAWNLPQHAGVVAYSPGESRAAHLTPDSPGGRAILRQMGVAE